MRAEIIAVGTELLLGDIVDTDTPFLAEQLARLGIDLYFTSSVGDNHERLLGALKQAWRRAELILTTGGLGPTQDDITREAIAGLLGEELKVDPGLKEGMVCFFARRGIDMPQNNVKQAALIPSAEAIINPQGTAPGWWIEREGRIIVAMPGPPSEMQLMWQNEVFPRLQQRAGAIILSRTIKTFALSEARVDELVAPLSSSSNPTLATYAKPDGIYLRITAKAGKAAEARAMLARQEAGVRAILDDYIWGVDDDTLEGTVGQLLSEKGLTLAVFEAFSPGLLTHKLASVPGSRDFFKGGLVATSDAVKVALGLDSRLVAGGAGVVTAAAMASLARSRLGASIGIGVDGYTEPGDGVAMDRVFIAIDNGQSERPPVESYSGGPHWMKRRMAHYALSKLGKLLRPS
ncbi:CinA family nicotinamide mononucleotide deamidase-related protein [Chloroflexota bacterium]